MQTNTNKIVKMGLLAALSVILLYLVRFPIIPAAPYLEYEPADVPILIGTFLYGPVSGLVITIVVAAVQAVTVSAASGWVGLVMHVIATGTLVLVAGNIYRRFHTIRGAIAALLAGSLAMTAVMIPNNLFFTVNFFGMPYDTVKASIVPIIIPFNLIKSITNSAVVMLIYKPIGRVLRRTAPGQFTRL
jgi:riboflavin transporter FmnP